MFSDPTSSIVSVIMIAGIVLALFGSHWVGRLNKELHAKNLAARTDQKGDL